MKPNVYVALDIEKTTKHCATRNAGIFAVGFAVIEATASDAPQVLEVKRFVLQVSDVMEESCRAFWSQHNPTFQALTAQQGTYSYPRELIDYIDSLYGRYTIQEWVTDNPAFDMGHLDVLLVKSPYDVSSNWARRTYPIRYSPSGEYVSVEIPPENQIQRAKVKADELCQQSPLIIKWAGPYLLQFHDPLYDALVQGLAFWFSRNE